MSTWHYQLVQHATGTDHPYVALHEVYRDEHGVIDMWTHDPVDFIGDTAPEVVDALQTALNDAQGRPVIDEKDLPAQ